MRKPTMWLCITRRLRSAWPPPTCSLANNFFPSKVDGVSNEINSSKYVKTLLCKVHLFNDLDWSSNDIDVFNVIVVRTYLPSRDQARGRLGRNICPGRNIRPRGRNFALNGTQGEMGVSLKKKFFFFFFRETHFYSVTTQTQAVLLPLYYVSPSIKWQ